MNTSSYVARKIVVLLALVAIVILSGARRGVQGQQWTGPDANGNISNANSGKVGVGTSAPVNLLEVGSAAIGTMLGNAIVVSNTTGPSSVAVGQSVTARGRMKWNFSGTEANAYMSLGVSAGTNPLILQDAGGNVGIGTMSPGARLYVAGGGYGSVGGANQSAYAFGAQSIAADASIYSYGAICAGNQHGNCASSGGVVIGINNTAAATNIPNAGNTIFNNGGSVGIGLTAPAYRLDVNGEINATGLRINGTPISTGGSLWSGTGPIYYNTANVGIGTSTPGAKLHVSAGDSSFALFGPNPTWGGSLAVGSGNAFITPISGRAQVLSSNGNLHLDGGSGQGVYLGWLNASNTIINGQGGNVGVGTNAPLAPLSVGNSAVANSDGYIVLGKHSGSGGSRHFRVGFDSSFNFVIGDYGHNNTAGPWLSPFAINWQAPSNSFYINSAGNIGMGKTTPPNYKLDVNGEVNATGFLINGTPISAGGGSQQWTPSGASIYYSSGRVGIGGAGADVYATDAWVENNMHVQGPETLAQGGRGRLRVGSAWGYSGLFADASSTGGVNDLVLGASSATVRVGPGGAAIQNFSVPNGNVGIGTAPSTYKLDVLGNTNVTGNLNVTGTVNAKYQDLAEWVPSSEQLSAGTVVVLDTTKSNQVISSGTAYDTRVAGVISAQPGITLGEGGEGKVLVATTGRVRVKVDASRGAIQIGDLLVTSDVAGVAMKSEAIEFAGRKMHMPGTIIGKALEPLAKGKGEILVLLSLQ